MTTPTEPSDVEVDASAEWHRRAADREGDLEAHAGIPTDDPLSIRERDRMLASGALPFESKVKMNPWIPMRNPVDLKVAGKLLEELGELTAILSRCVIQGVHEREPVTGKLNKLALEEEIADVMTGLELIVRRFDLDRRAMNQRITVKLPQLENWHKMTHEPTESAE